MAGSVVTIGNFDGVHLGHQEIIQRTLDQARELGLESVGFTFRPHPQSVLRPDRAPELILSYDEKRERLLGLGLSRVIEQPFDLSFSTTPPAQFFSGTLRAGLDIRAIVVGYDFTFGKERSGHLQVLQGLCDAAGVRLTVVAPCRHEQEVVSSSAIRGLLKQGQVREAGRLMGTPFFYAGPVIRGDQRGRGLGFPTANLELGEKIVLPYGVYATRAWVGGQPYCSVTHVGTRPTFKSGDQRLSETHLMEGHWAQDGLYGSALRIEFMERIREEQKFSGPEALRAQISRDLQAVRRIFDGTSPR